MFDDSIRAPAAKLIGELIDRGLSIAIAESCTGGLIVGALTEVPGSSATVYGGFVTYANEAKVTMIGVNEGLLAEHGAVSAAVARAMAEGARRTAMVDIAIAVTGIAGPGGGSDDKPVGLVHMACATVSGTTHVERRFGSVGRSAVREATVKAALELALACVEISVRLGCLVAPRRFAQECIENFVLLACERRLGHRGDQLVAGTRTGSRTGRRCPAPPVRTTTCCRGTGTDRR